MDDETAGLWGQLSKKGKRQFLRRVRFVQKFYPAEELPKEHPPRQWRDHTTRKLLPPLIIGG